MSAQTQRAAEAPVQSASPAGSGNPWIDAAEALVPRLAAAAAQHDAQASFVAANLAALKEAGLYRAGVPAELGGGGADHATLSEVIRILSRACGSTGLAFSMHTHLVMMNAWRWRHDKAPLEPLLKRIAAENLILVSTGGYDWLGGGGKAEKVEGGFRITARKAFASGAPAGDILMTSAVLEEDGERKVLHFGVPLKHAAVRLLDNWNTLGMRGTGSGDALVEGFVVPEAAIGVRRPAGQWHHLFHVITMLAFPLIYSAYFGLAEAARQVALAAALPRRDQVETQLAVGQLETELAACRAAWRELLRLAASDAPGPETSAAVMTAKALVTRHALAVADLAMNLCGGAAYFKGHALERIFRDLQAARFHPLNEAQQRRLAGRLALGLPADL